MYKTTCGAHKWRGGWVETVGKGESGAHLVM